MLHDILSWWHSRQLLFGSCIISRISVLNGATRLKMCAQNPVDLSTDVNQWCVMKQTFCLSTLIDKMACRAVDIHTYHDDVIKRNHFPRYWPFVRGIRWSPGNSLHKGQWRGALMFSLISAWINGWVNNREAGDLRHYRAHYDVIVMM